MVVPRSGSHENRRLPCSYKAPDLHHVPRPFISPLNSVSSRFNMTANQWMTQDMVDMSDKVVFVTGGNGGEEP
jgi:hypothetical protein